MKKLIILLSLCCCSFYCYSQDLHITNCNTDAKLIIEGKPKRFQITSFSICPYDLVDYVIYHNWSSPDILYIPSFQYSKLYEWQNKTTETEKQQRCKTLQNAKEIAIVELPDNVTQITSKYINNILQYSCQTWHKYLDNITGYLTILSVNKYSKFYYGYGSYGGKDKKPVIIFYY